MNDYEKGWIEAMIDGEGSLSLLKEKRPKFKAGVTFKARLSIGNTDIRLLEHAQKIIGGGCIVQRKQVYPNRKPFFSLDVSANLIRQLLPKIQLIGKDKQRLLLLDALSIIDRHSGRTIPRTDCELKRLEEIYTEIRAKNGTRWNKH